MTAGYDLVVRDGYLYGEDAVADIAVSDGQIVAIESSIGGAGEEEIDADGDLVGPGFVDGHVHLDKALSAAGGRFPKLNDGGSDFSSSGGGFGAEYQREATKEEIERNAIEVGRRAVANGTLHMRTHVNVGEEVGTKLVEAILSAREELDGLLDLQVVPLPGEGVHGPAEELLRESLDMGADVVGGTDPATRSRDTDATIETWFEVARDHDAEVDPHIQHPGTLGVHVLNRLAEKTEKYEYGGRVTASHSYCLAEMHGREYNADAPGFTPAELKAFREGGHDVALPRYADVGMKFVTCHPSSRPGMPLHELSELDVPVGWGSDNIQDWVIRHAQPDALRGALVNAFKLDYNLYTYATNQGLDLLWRLCTSGGAEVLGIDGYGIEEGAPADLVVFDEPSPQWAIIDQATRRYVIKGGDVVARDGEVVADA